MKILVISGTGTSAVHSANTLNALFRDHTVVNIQEVALTLGKITQTIAKRIRSKGIVNATGMVAGYAYNILQKHAHVVPTYTPDYVTRDINRDARALDVIKNARPDAIVTLGCSILDKVFLQHVITQIINIHPGINPLYRGSGNIWACYDGKFDCTGVTVHNIDTGIDTGEIIANKFVSFRNKNINFTNFNDICMAEGSSLVYDFLTRGVQHCEESFNHLQDKFRGIPTLPQLLQAKKNFAAFKQRRVFQ